MRISTHQEGPPPAEADSAVIFIHGRGSTGQDVSGIARVISAKGVHWSAPSAPTGSWYPRRFLVPVEENEPHLSEALGIINNLVCGLERAGLPTERMGLIGFSQGACLALEYAFRHARRYAFVAALSGALVGPLGTPRVAVDLQQTPVLLGCAEQDAHIPEAFVDESHRVLLDNHASVTRQRFPGSTHTVFPEEVEWIRHTLPRIGS